jgi:predicted membrane protein
VTLDTRSTPRITPKVVVGLGICVFGLLLTAGNLGWLDAEELWRYFPMVIVAGGLAKFFSSSTTSGRMTGVVGVCIGAWWTADNLDLVHAHLWDWWPLIFVVMGLRVIFASQRQAARDSARAQQVAPDGSGAVQSTPDQYVTAFAFWSSVRRRIVSAAFKGGDLTALMGGVMLDLRGASLAGGEATVDIFAIWGGIEIRVPPDWSVSNQAIAIMGGVDDKSMATADARQRLVVRGFVMMGGVEIKP